jgi:hypothetical protein
MKAWRWLMGFLFKHRHAGTPEHAEGIARRLEHAQAMTDDHVKRHDLRNDIQAIELVNSEQQRRIDYLTYRAEQRAGFRADLSESRPADAGDAGDAGHGDA